MLVKITWKRLVFTLIAVGLGVYIYLDRINYFFDREIRSVATPLIKQIMKDGYYRLEKRADAFEGVQMSVDMFDILVSLTKKNRYKDIAVASILLSEDTMMTLRFTGDDKIDNVLSSSKNISHNTDNIFLAHKKNWGNAQILLNVDKNFRLYTLHRDSFENCMQCNVLLDNVKKYPHQIFAIKADKSAGTMNCRLWVMKYKKYYYLMALHNMSPNNNQHKLDEQFITWRKLTENELRSYDNGTYWRLIKDYNIKIS